MPFLRAEKVRPRPRVSRVFRKRMQANLKAKGARHSAPGSARYDPIVQFVIYDLDRAVDLGIGHAKLM